MLFERVKSKAFTGSITQRKKIQKGIEKLCIHILSLHNEWKLKLYLLWALQTLLELESSAGWEVAAAGGQTRSSIHAWPHRHAHIAWKRHPWGPETHALCCAHLSRKLWGWGGELRGVAGQLGVHGYRCRRLRLRKGLGDGFKASTL